MSGTNSTFDPYTQPITIFLADGVTPISISIADIDFIYSYTMKLCINYGAQLGACLVMFFVLAVLTTEKNRRKPLFALNLLSLFLGFLRTLLLALYNVSPWTELYTFYSMDFSAVPRSAYATSVAATVIPLLMTITINMSLTVQTYTVCKIMEKKYAYPVIAMSFIVVLLAIGFRFAQVVTNSIAILTLNLYSPQWIRAGTLITGTMAIWWFSIVFTGKLIWTLYNRKRQGWKQWGAVRVLAIMGGCTMIIPC
jgi:pheromone alpha factor receptor